MQEEILRLLDILEQMESSKIPRWAYNFQGKDWEICNPFNSEFSGQVCVIQNDYPVVVASIGKEDELIIVRGAKRGRN